MDTCSPHTTPCYAHYHVCTSAATAAPPVYVVVSPVKAKKRRLLSFFSRFFFFFFLLSFSLSGACLYARVSLARFLPPKRADKRMYVLGYSLPSRGYLVYTKFANVRGDCLTCDTRLPFTECTPTAHHGRRFDIGASLPDLSPGPHLVPSCCVPSVPSYTPSRSILPAYDPHCTLTRTSATRLYRYHATSTGTGGRAR